MTTSRINIKGGVDLSLRQWILAAAGSLPATGAVKALVPVDSSTSKFRTALHDMGMSYNDMYTGFETAYNSLSSYANDTLLVFPGGHSSGAAMITWAKHYTNVIGVGPAAAFGGRCRITLQAADVATALTISARGTTWKNIKFQWGNANASAVTAVKLTYSGNCDDVWENCAFEGPNSATEGITAFRILEYGAGCQDHTFRDCYIGSFSAQCDQSPGALVYFGTDMARMLFDRCMFVANSTDTTTIPIQFAGSFSSEGVGLFRDCFMTNADVNVTIAAYFTGPTSGNGRILLHNCAASGVGAWAVANDSVRVACGPTQGAAGGLGVAAA
jgi:hypothetical protein